MRLRCYLKGCDWRPLANYDAKQCARCEARMTATDVIRHNKGQRVLETAIAYAATGGRPSDKYWLSLGWPGLAPAKYLPCPDHGHGGH